MKNTVFMCLTVLLTGFILFCTVMTVQGREMGQNTETEAYYRSVESRLLEEIRIYLTEQGFKNSGVTLKRIVDEDGSREYRFTIHHSRIDYMSGEERNQLNRVLKDKGESILKEHDLEEYFIGYEFLIL